MSRNAAPHILNQGIRWQRVASFTHRPFYPHRNRRGNHGITKLGQAVEPVYEMWVVNSVPLLENEFAQPIAF
jgi:hypothetical protein